MGVRDKTKMDKETIENAYMAFINQFTMNHEHVVYFKKALKEALDTATEKDISESKRLHATIEELSRKQTALINKNDKGIISDAILRRQLDQIEVDLTKTNAALYSIPSKKEDIGALLDFATEYLEKPGSVWGKASFQQKIELQWFVFPSGIEFENGTFRTREIVSIFNVKDAFLPSLSSSVDTKRLKYEPSTNSNVVFKTLPLETWQQYAKELSRLVTILQGTPQ